MACVESRLELAGLGVLLLQVSVVDGGQRVDRRRGKIEVEVDGDEWRVPRHETQQPRIGQAEPGKGWVRGRLGAGHDDLMALTDQDAESHQQSRSFRLPVLPQEIRCLRERVGRDQNSLEPTYDLLDAFEVFKAERPQPPMPRDDVWIQRSCDQQH